METGPIRALAALTERVKKQPAAPSLKERPERMSCREYRRSLSGLLDSGRAGAGRVGLGVGANHARDPLDPFPDLDLGRV